MKGLVFWVEANLGSASELWQDPLRLLSEALSEHLPLWLIRFYRHHSAPAYEMAIWNGRGREITFWGNWSSSRLSQVVEAFWQAEEFMPAAIVHIASQKTECPARWKRRFKSVMVDFLSAAGRPQWPHSGLPQVPIAGKNRLLIPVNSYNLKTAHELGRHLLGAGWSLLFTGWAAETTLLRRLHSHHPRHVTIYLGLSWLDIESLLDTCQAVVLPTAQPLLLALPWGKPVFYPGLLPWDAPGLHPYEGVEDLLAHLPTRKLPYAAPPTPAQIAAQWVKWLEKLSQDPLS